MSGWHTGARLPAGVVARNVTDLRPGDKVRYADHTELMVVQVLHGDRDVIVEHADGTTRNIRNTSTVRVVQAGGAL